MTGPELASTGSMGITYGQGLHRAREYIGFRVYLNRFRDYIGLGTV